MPIQDLQQPNGVPNGVAVSEADPYRTGGTASDSAVGQGSAVIAAADTDPVTV